MPFGKVKYDEFADIFQCEWPVKKDGQNFACGKWCRDLVRHIKAHGITAIEYKKAFGLDKKESLMSKATTKKLRKANIEQKTYKNLQPHDYKFLPGDTRVQNYSRSEQTRERLRSLRNKAQQGKIKK